MDRHPALRRKRFIILPAIPRTPRPVGQGLDEVGQSAGIVRHALRHPTPRFCFAIGAKGGPSGNHQGVHRKSLNPIHIFMPGGRITRQGSVLRDKIKIPFIPLPEGLNAKPPGRPFRRIQNAPQINGLRQRCLNLPTERFKFALPCESFESLPDQVHLIGCKRHR